jgi:hypothetical protein
MRSIFVILLLAAGCGQDNPVAVAPDLAVGDLATGDLAAACVPPASGPTPCGPLTCAAGEFCFREEYGAPCVYDLSGPVDGGTPFCGDYACAKLPSDCDCSNPCAGNGQQGLGCLHVIPSCQYAVGCQLSGVTITCGDI